MSKAYCTWARDAVQRYYDTLLKMEQDNPYTDLRMKRGQIEWTLEELIEWDRRISEYQ